jgi:hypothetical protein
MHGTMNVKFMRIMGYVVRRTNKIRELCFGRGNCAFVGIAAKYFADNNYSKQNPLPGLIGTASRRGFKNLVQITTLAEASYNLAQITVLAEAPLKIWCK